MTYANQKAAVATSPQPGEKIMPNDKAPQIDFKALAREIRSHGIGAGQEANRLLEDGEIERAQALSEASTALAARAVELEEWRQEQARTLRRAALATATQRGALADFEMKDGPEMRPREKILFHNAANITEGLQEVLEEIAHQLNPRNQEEAQ